MTIRDSRDRVDPKLGYVKGNIQWISARANRLKDENTVETLIAILDYMERYRND